jgi:hypothetical protein
MIIVSIIKGFRSHRRGTPGFVSRSVVEIRFTGSSQGLHPGKEGYDETALRLFGSGTMHFLGPVFPLPVPCARE